MSYICQFCSRVTILANTIFRLRTTGSQPARLYELAKIHKSGTPLRPVLSIPGSSYENLNKFLSPIFERLLGANIETNTETK